MNTITSNAEITTLPTLLAGDDKQAGQAARSLTERAVDDVKQTEAQNQQNYSKINTKITIKMKKLSR